MAPNDEGERDIFADAGGMGGGMAFQGEGMFGNASGGVDNDLTPEEQELIQKVDADNQERKKGIYAKQIEEEDKKAQKKANAA